MRHVFVRCIPAQAAALRTTSPFLAQMKRAGEFCDAPECRCQARPRCANIVRLNVGGHHYDTTKETLDSLPFFRPYLEGRYDLARDDEGRLFVDRDGERFRQILQFARDARRPARGALEIQREALLAECDFFLCDKLAHYIRDDVSPYDMRAEDRILREEEACVREGGGPDCGMLFDFFRQDRSPLPRQQLQPHALLDKAPRATAQGDFADFHNRLNKFAGGFLTELRSIPDVLVAGGSVIGALVDAPSSDLDIFLTCAPNEAERRLKSLYEAMQRHLAARGSARAKLLVTRSVNAITFHCCEGAAVDDTMPPVQIILRLGRSVADVLCSFDVDACCCGYVPSAQAVLCLPRFLRAVRFSANLVDTGVSGDSYARRLEKYAKRGFAIMVPGYAPERVSHNVLRGSYAHFPRSGLLLRVGPRLLASAAPVAAGIRADSLRAGTAVRNLERLVVLDSGVACQHDNDRARVNSCVVVPIRADDPGEYMILSGRTGVDANVVERLGAEEDDEGLYVSPASLVPGIVEKACRVDEEKEDPPTPEGWRAGGTVRRTTGNVLAIAAEPIEAASEGDIMCVYDLVTRGAAFSSLRYVTDARQPPLDGLDASAFERRFAFPATACWRAHEKRTCVREFTRGVYS